MTYVIKPIKIDGCRKRFNVFVSRRNKRIMDIVPNLHLLLNSQDDKHIKSVSDLICKWIVEKYDELGGSEAVTPQTPNKSTDKLMSSPDDNDDKENNTISYLKRFMSKQSKRVFKFYSIPKINDYCRTKIGGKSVSEAYEDDDIDFETAADIYVSALSIHADIKRDRLLSKDMHLISSKNDTKKKGKIKFLHNRIKKVLGDNKACMDALAKCKPIEGCNKFLEDYEIIDYMH